MIGSVLLFGTGKEYTVEVAEADIEGEVLEEAPGKEEEEKEEEMVVEETTVKMKVVKEGGVRGVRIRASPSLSVSVVGNVSCHGLWSLFGSI